MTDDELRELMIRASDEHNTELRAADLVHGEAVAAAWQAHDALETPAKEELARALAAAQAAYDSVSGPAGAALHDAIQEANAALADAHGASKARYDARIAELTTPQAA